MKYDNIFNLKRTKQKSNVFINTVTVWQLIDTFSEKNQ